MDWSFLTFLLSVLALFVGFLARKRLAAWFGRLLLHGAIEFARATFVEERTETREDGSSFVSVRLRPTGEALVGAVAPVLLAAGLKSIKLKPGALPVTLPAGIDLSNLTEALPAILPMLPKRYQGIAALLAPLASQFLGGGQGVSASHRKSESTETSGRVVR